MNTKKGSAVILSILLGLVLIGASYFYFQKSKESEENITNNKVEQNQADENEDSLSNNYYETQFGFNIKIPEGWIPVEGDNRTTTIIPDVAEDEVLNKGDQIKISLISGNEVFEKSSGKFGRYTLSFSEENECWMVGQSNAKSDFSENCSDPIGYSGPKPIFVSNGGYSYVMAESKESFIHFELIGDSKDALEEIVGSL